MTSLTFDNRVVNREVDFCKVYTLESKEKLERVLLKNRISYFIEWQERSWFSITFGSDKQKNIFTIRINEADVERAADLIRGIESVKIKNTSED